MTLGEFYDKIESWPSDTMNFKVTDVFSWRGIYAEPCCSISLSYSTKIENLNMLKRLLNETFEGYKGGEYTYTFDDTIHFECEEDSYSDGKYLYSFLIENGREEIIKHIFL